MAWYIAKRVFQMVPLLVGIATILFFVMHLAPGDPVEMYLRKRHRILVTGSAPDSELEQAIRRKYGLDRPLPVQYAMWLGNLARGDLGESILDRRPVTRLIAETLPYTLQLTVLALILGAIIGIAMGILSAVKQDSLLDRAVTISSVTLYSVPEFWLAVMFILVFSINLGLFPLSQTRSLDYGLMPAAGKFADRLWHLVLPVSVLALSSAAGTARYMRNQLAGVLREEFVTAARARGLPEAHVVLRHALRNAVMPIVTIYGLQLPFLVGGAAVVETIFAWPGMGAMAVAAAGYRDYPVIMATSMMAALLVVTGNLLADVMYAVVDPRVSLNGDGTR